MPGMTVRTSRSQHVSVLSKLRVSAFIIYCRDLIVAVSAFNRGQPRRMFITLNIGIFMAGQTAVFSVYSLFEKVKIDIKTDFFAILDYGKILVAMAVGAVIITQGVKPWAYKQHQGQPTKQDYPDSCFKQERSLHLRTPAAVKFHAILATAPSKPL